MIILKSLEKKDPPPFQKESKRYTLFCMFCCLK